MQETRRVRMTKKMIKDAYIELLEINPDKRLSITEICQRADINRSTFYMHYEDVNQLVKEIEDEILDQIPYPELSEGSLSQKEQYIDLLKDTFEYIKINKSQFILLLSQLDSNDFKKRLISTILDKYKALTISDDSLMSKYGYMFCINGVVGLLREWIKDNFPISSADLAKIAFNMSLQATDFSKIFNKK
ncbi:MAG: TetR family transcriptional regulator C-terminal domain-containing protein, partial [Clostridia bacterium]|nr:TetR family transcriptional regulator C-terminal domain-containing protein [Clostridia bacterium]